MDQALLSGYQGGRGLAVVEVLRSENRKWLQLCLRQTVENSQVRLRPFQAYNIKAQQLLNSVNTEIGLKLWPIGFMENAFEFDSISQNIEMRLDDDASER